MNIFKLFNKHDDKKWIFIDDCYVELLNIQQGLIIRIFLKALVVIVQNYIWQLLMMLITLGL